LTASVAVSERVAQVRDERVEVVCQAAGGRLVAAMFEFAGEDLEAELAVLDARCVGER